jgi:hypothetical protein
MKKYFLFVVAIIALVVMASGCTSNQTGNNSTATKTYSANGVSFNYPSNWVIINETSNANVTAVALGDAVFKQNNGTQGNGVTIIRLPQTNNSSDELASLKSSFSSFNATNNTITVAGVTANETTFNASSNNVTAQLKLIDFQKNNFVYIFQYVTVNSDFQTQQQLFDTITKSFQTT